MPPREKTMPQDRPLDGLSESLGDPLVAAIEDALTLATFSFARPRRHNALLRTHEIPVCWAAWRTQPALYALLDRIARSRTARPSHLAAALGLSRSTVSHELRRLEERQLIYRNDFAVPAGAARSSRSSRRRCRVTTHFVSCAAYAAPRWRRPRGLA